MSPSILRLLASSAPDSESGTGGDVSIISLVVITLALILLFEVIRRQLDAAVSGHHFFQAVVDLIYREITTLGLVEFCLYLVHKYVDSINYEVEALFVDVHFMLFYTALFNAIQGCLIRLLAGHRTDKSWVHTEDIDIGHYVAIRKEFDRLDKMIPYPSNNVNEKQSSYSLNSFQRVMRQLTFKIRHPQLSRRKNQLLVPIRFHELRAHMIDSYNLPPRFKVSHYLKRSLTSVLLDFVHISPVAWIMLMATTNLMYFASGIIRSVSKDEKKVDGFFAFIAISMMLCFVSITFVLYFHMKSIFSKILHMKLTVFDAEEEITRTWRGFSALRSSTTKSVNQLDLFWGRSPRLVIVIIQYMQFGYALGFSFLFTFPQDLAANKYYFWLLLGLPLSYLVFLLLMMETIPWYTLCTSMGQLVNLERLHETSAQLKLSEEIRKKESLKEEEKAKEKNARRKSEVEARNTRAAAKAAAKAAAAAAGEAASSARNCSGLFSNKIVPSVVYPLSSETRKSVHTRKKSLSDGVLTMTTNISHGDLLLSGSHSPSGSARLSAVAALQLQNVMEDETHLSEIQSKQQRRQFFTKSISDSVAFMREANSDLEVPVEKPITIFTDNSINSPSSPSTRSPESDVVKGHFESPRLFDELSDLPSERRGRKEGRRFMKAQSEGVSIMRLSLPNESKMLSFGPETQREPGRLVTLSELTQLTVKDLPENPTFKRKVRSNRHQRKKSASDGVALMRAGITSVAATRAFADDLATRNTDMSKYHQNYEVGDEKSVIAAVKSRVSFSTGQMCDAKEESIDSTASDLGDDSDIDDVPEAMLKITVARQGRMQACVQSINLASFFQSVRYRIMSALFGPMTCFFSIATRVDVFNSYSEFSDGRSSIFSDMLPFSFWLEISLYCIMMAEMLLILAVFSTKRGSRGSFISSTAAVLGLTINLVCLILLLISETERCCPDDKNTLSRLLATDPLEEYGDPKDAYDECCPKFGQRKYGGLGKFEPFTALIGLSPMRFLVAFYIANLFGISATHEEVLHHDEESHGHHGPDPTDRVRSYWLTAIGVHSEIAKTCGLFSGELLQCMLGIYSDSYSNESVTSTGDVLRPDVNNDVSDNESCQHEGNENDQITFDTSSLGLMGSPTTPTISRNDFGVTFEYPKARLVRRMRRCEMRLLPLMGSEWNVVDVVLTSHELVLFDVTNATVDLGLLPSSTDGHKGLYLSDVAKGRKIVSQFTLDEIDFLDIEHRAPIPRGESERDDVEATQNYSLLEHWQGGNGSCEDYEVDVMNIRWSYVAEDRIKIHFKYSTLFLRFMADLKEMEHRSKASNTLDDSGLTVHVGAEAKVWCRTIARLRGASNLRWQNLPHFGDEGTEEIEDFVNYCDREHDNIQNTMKTHRALYRRTSSLGFDWQNVWST